MNKKSQSILDLILPNRMMVTRKSPITNKEAKTLLELWDIRDLDEYGRIKVPGHIDSETIISLATKGYLSTSGKSRHTIMSQASLSTVSFTDKAKDAIKKIILHTEKSAFEKKNKEPDYESIMLIAEKQAGNKSHIKVASKQPIQNSNWFKKIVQK